MALGSSFRNLSLGFSIFDAEMRAQGPLASRKVHGSLAELRQQWDSLLKNLPERILSTTEFRGFVQRFRSVLCESSPEILCRDLIGVANSASSWEELSGFREQVLQWALAQAPNKSLKEQASHALRKLSGNPNSLSESVQFLAHDIGRHPVRLSLLAGIGAAGFGMRMGRLAGTAWAQVRGFGAVGQFVARSSVGLGAELGFFSAGTRAAHLLEGQKIDWSASAIGQEMLSGLCLLGPMKLINHLGHLGRVTGGLRLLQAGTAHYAGASIGTWASALANKQALTSYQIFSGATHLMFEGAIASGLLSTGLPRLEAAHRALDLKTRSMLRQSMRTAWSRAWAFSKQGWKGAWGGGLMGVQEALAMGPKGEGLNFPNLISLKAPPQKILVNRMDRAKVFSTSAKSPAEFIKIADASAILSLRNLVLTVCREHAIKLHPNTLADLNNSTVGRVRDGLEVIFSAQAEGSSGVKIQRFLENPRHVAKLPPGLEIGRSLELSEPLAGAGFHRVRPEPPQDLAARLRRLLSQVTDFGGTSGPLEVLKFSVDRASEEDLQAIFGLEPILVNWIELVGKRKWAQIPEGSFTVTLQAAQHEGSLSFSNPEIRTANEFHVEPSAETRLLFQKMPEGHRFPLVVKGVSGTGGHRLAYAWLGGRFPSLSRDPFLRSMVGKYWGLEAPQRAVLTVSDKDQFLARLKDLELKDSDDIGALLGALQERSLDRLEKWALVYDYYKEGACILKREQFIPIGELSPENTKHRSVLQLAPFMLGKYSKGEFEAFFENPDKLEAKLRRWWRIHHGDKKFPLRQNGDRIVLTTQFTRNRVDYDKPSFVTMEDLPQALEDSGTKSGKLKKPFFVLHYSNLLIGPSKIVLQGIKGIETHQVAKAWLRGYLGTESEDPVIMAVLYDRWEFQRSQRRSPTRLQVDEFATRVKSDDGTYMRKILGLLSAIDAKEHSQESRLTLWGRNYKGDIPTIGNVEIVPGIIKPEAFSGNMKPIYVIDLSGENVRVEAVGSTFK